MGGESKQETQTSQATSNTFDPWVTNAGSGLYSQAASTVAGAPYQGYAGPTQGAFGAGTQTASDFLTQALGTNGGVNADTSGASTAFQKVIGAIDPNRTTGSYMSPYTDAALSPTLRKINESADTLRMQNGAEASMAGAWGGSGMGVAQALADRSRETAIGDATGAAYDKAWTNAQGARQADLASLLQAASGQAGTGAQASQQSTGLATMLAGLGGQEQQANQTGINTAIQVNDSNQMGQIKQDSQLAQILAMLPKNTSGTSVGNSTTTTPDNSGMALFGSILGSIF